MCKIHARYTQGDLRHTDTGSVWKTREVWREREMNSGPRQNFPKTLNRVALYSRNTRVLTYEKDTTFAQGYF